MFSTTGKLVLIPFEAGVVIRITPLACRAKPRPVPVISSQTKSQSRIMSIMVNPS
jgi:hypothetical protein